MSTSGKESRKESSSIFTGKRKIFTSMASLTDNEILKLAEERSLRDLGRLSPAYLKGYLKGWRDEEKHH
jgi:hypothetical protein